MECDSDQEITLGKGPVVGPHQLARVGVGAVDERREGGDEARRRRRRRRRRHQVGQRQAPETRRQVVARRVGVAGRVPAAGRLGQLLAQLLRMLLQRRRTQTRAAQQHRALEQVCQRTTPIKKKSNHEKSYSYEL